MSEPSKQRPRVLYVLNAYDRGGAEDGLARLVEGGAFAGLDLRVAALVRGAHAQAAVLEAHGVEPAFLLDRPNMRTQDLPGIALALAKLLRRDRPDALILSLPQANLLGRLVGSLFGVRLVCSFEHNTRLAKPIYERLFRATSRSVNWLLADNAATAREAERRLYRHPPQRRFVLPLFSAGPAAEGPPRTALAGRPFHIVNAGRFTAVKNQAAIIDAVALLVEQGLEVRLTLFGDGPLRSAYEEQVRRLGLLDRVVMPGHVRGWATLPADAFVLASRHEGLCIVLLEALAAGLPAVAPGVGGVADYGEEAQVAVIKDLEPATIARAVERLAADPVQYAAQSKAGRAMIDRRYSQAAVHETYARFSQALCAELCGPGAV